MMNRIIWDDLNELQRISILTRPASKIETLTEQVTSIISQVKNGGDRAVIELTKKYDKVTLANSRVTDAEFVAAESNVSRELVICIQQAINRIEHYHCQLLPKEVSVDTQDGVVCKRVPRPIDKIGLYVPGGTAPLFSTLIMLAIPAKIAGCRTRVLCTPARGGGVDPILLVTAKRCGIDTVYKIGGAQAIAAMAYGTETIPKVNKIVGPGNAWVTEAKRQVALDPRGAAIDMPAGPSEVIVIADESANPEFIAADLLAQAEHGIDSPVILITDSAQLSSNVEQLIQSQLLKLSRQEIVRESLKNGFIILVDKITQAFDISNQYAPEHLIIQLSDADNYLDLIDQAGAVFVGTWTPEVLGDYITGSNHVLPTGGYAACYSGLSVDSFMKTISIQSVSENGFRKLGPIAATLAEAEGLDAHSNAIGVRMKYLEHMDG